MSDSIEEVGNRTKSVAQNNIQRYENINNRYIRKDRLSEMINEIHKANLSLI